MRLDISILPNSHAEYPECLYFYVNAEPSANLQSSVTASREPAAAYCEIMSCSSTDSKWRLVAGFMALGAIAQMR
jgi:hypothetical protein